MNIESRPLDTIRPYEGNPRVNDQAVDAVAESIRQFGFRVPIIVDADGVIVAGHTRLKAALKLGLTEVPVHVAADLTPDQIRALRIADNKVGELADWDLEKLTIELEAIQAADLDLDLAAFGFDQDELATLLGGGVGAGLTDPDAVPAPPDAAVTRTGDLWILGDHRLLCGDSGSPTDLDRLLDGQPIHLVNTDPPYNVKVEPRSNNAIAAGLSSFPSTTPAGAHHQGFDLERHPEKAQATHQKLRAKDRPLANDFVTDEAFDQLLAAWFGNITRVLQPGRGFYIWGGYANLGNYPGPLKVAGLYFSQAIVWDKQHPVLTRKDYMGAFELCQPPDTTILTPSGSSKLAGLRDGDQVVSFSRSSSAVIGWRHGPTVRTTKRTYMGNLYGVVVGARTTWCTDGHLWTVRIQPKQESWFCVYLMRRGQWWRIGRCQLYTTWGFGLKQRLLKEIGDEAWILSVHRTREEASMVEQLASIHYGIPTTYWEQCAVSRRTSEQIRFMYECMDLETMERSAERALREHRRCRQYPFLQSDHTREKISTRIPNQIRACNLLPEVMSVPIPDGGPAFHWEPIRAIDVQSYDGPVHSMEVSKHHHYVADGIITHNCFYGWKEGAAHVYLGPNNATDLWHVKKVNPQSMVHLTEKPVELAIRAIQYSSRPGENVLDLFGGSGSTLIGCQQTGRRAHLMELDELYCDVIVQRFAEFTGTDPVRVGPDGGRRHWKELIAERDAKMAAGTPPQDDVGPAVVAAGAGEGVV